MSNSAERMDELDRLLMKHSGRRGALLPLLHDIQHAYGHIADAVVPRIAEALNISRADVHGVVTFYADFRRVPAGKHVLKLCRAEACQARGGAEIEAAIIRQFGVEMGGTRGDGHVSLEPVYCLGLCAIGPAALVDGQPVARLDPDRIASVAAELSA